MNQSAPDMDYRYLGNTGLKVSAFGFGNWINSDDDSTTERDIGLIKKAYDLGVNFFDTAEMYGAGNAEKIMGKAFKELNLPRESIVVCNKMFFGPQGGQNANGLSRKKVIESTRASLKRMQLEYFDIVLAHVYDYNTPIEETCRAFDWMVRHELCHYWGTSNWPAQRIMEAFRICDKLGLIKPILEQCEYNMLHRQEIEGDMVELFKEYHYGSTVYSPLCGGMLTGKYNTEIPEGSRYSQYWVANHTMETFEKFLGEEQIEKTQTKLKSLNEIAKSLDCTQAQLSLAWDLANKDVSVTILGATKPEQLEENVKAFAVSKKITKEIEGKINGILGNRPEQLTDCVTYVPYPDRRLLGK